MSVFDIKMLKSSNPDDSKPAKSRHDNVAPSDRDENKENADGPSSQEIKRRTFEYSSTSSSEKGCHRNGSYHHILRLITRTSI